MGWTREWARRLRQRRRRRSLGARQLHALSWLDRTTDQDRTAAPAPHDRIATPATPGRPPEPDETTAPTPPDGTVTAEPPDRDAAPGPAPAAATPGAGSASRHEPSTARVVLVGSFGTGKSSLMRHLLGTTGHAPGFPAVAPGKTTTALTEVRCRPGGFSAEATFLPAEQVRSALRDNVVAAHVGALRGDSERQLRLALLDHRSERLRLTHVFGASGRSESDVAAVPGAATDPGANTPQPPSAGDVRRGTVEVIVHDLVDWAATQRPLVDVEDPDQAETHVREHADVDLLADLLLADLKRSVAAARTRGQLVTDPNGWPIRWALQSQSRAGFLQDLALVAGTPDPRRGQPRLTTLVSALAVQGPFAPAWSEHVPALHLIDTSGHAGTITSGGDPSADPELRALIETADAVVLVDTAAGGRVGTPTQNVMRLMAQADRVDRLHLVLTHMDRLLDAGGHVDEPDEACDQAFASVRRAAQSLAPELGGGPARALEASLEQRTVFAFHLDEPLRTAVDLHEATLRGLRALVAAISGPGVGSGRAA